MLVCTFTNRRYKILTVSHARGWFNEYWYSSSFMACTHITSITRHLLFLWEVPVPINVKENRRGNQEWTIQRNRHTRHRTKTIKKQNNTDPTNDRGWNQAQEFEQSCICALGLSNLSFFTIFPLDFGIIFVIFFQHFKALSPCVSN